MGKGDKKTRKGKISMGSFGVTRPRTKNRAIVEPVKESVTKKAAPKKKAPAAKKKKED